MRTIYEELPVQVNIQKLVTCQKVVALFGKEMEKI